jgi:iron complex transport system substrate-binding protein
MFRKNAFFFPVFLLVIFGMVACHEAKKSNESGEFPINENICKYSQWLQISPSTNGAFISIKHPETGATKYYFIGNQPIDDSKSIFLPVNQKLATLSATHIGMLSKINATDRIGAISSQKLLYNQLVKANCKKGAVMELGDEGQVSIDKLIRSQSRILIYSAFGGSFSQEEQLSKLGITCLPNFDWRETHPLGKAEWLLLFGFLSGKEKMARQVFQDIEQNYLAIKNGLKKEKGKKVMAGNLAGDTWYTPAGESYFALLMADAGMNYLHQNTKGTGSLAHSIEQVLVDTKDCDLWINPGFSSKKQILQQNPKATFLAPFQNGKMACYAFDMNRFWEESAVNPHLLLKDLALLNTASVNEKELTFYKLVK